MTRTRISALIATAAVERRRRPPVESPSHTKVRDRYDLRHAVEPPNGRGVPPKSDGYAAVDVVAIEDPMADLRTGRKGRLLATVNRRVDILETERAHGRISDEAYCEGRLCQAVYERAKGPTGGGQWLDGSRVDAELAKELAIIRSIDDARKIQRHIDRTRSVLGWLDSRIVEQVLRDGFSYSDLCAARGRAPSRDSVGYFAQRFRDALETLARARGQIDRNLTLR